MPKSKNFGKDKATLKILTKEKDPSLKQSLFDISGLENIYIVGLFCFSIFILFLFNFFGFNIINSGVWVYSLIFFIIIFLGFQLWSNKLIFSIYCLILLCIGYYFNQQLPMIEISILRNIVSTYIYYGLFLSIFVGSMALFYIFFSKLVFIRNMESGLLRVIPIVLCYIFLVLFMFISIFWALSIVFLSIFLIRWLHKAKKFQDLINFLSSIILIAILGYLFSIIPYFGLFSFAILCVCISVILSEINDLFKLYIQDKSRRRVDVVDVLGVQINNETVESAIGKMDKLINSGEFSYVVTPYSEYVVKAQRDRYFRDALNNGVLSLSDGIFVLWAAYLRSLELSNNFVIRLVEGVFHFILSGILVIFYPDAIRSVLRAKVSGSELIRPLMELALKRGYSVFFYGGFDFGHGNTGILASERLSKEYPGLKIKDVYPGKRSEESSSEALKLINKANPDILVVCVKGGEEWLFANRSQLKCGLGISLGGTFDFVAGEANKVDVNLGYLGLEWFFRGFSKQGGGFNANIKRFFRVWTGFLESSMYMLIDKIT
ncbi:WecB/TagA/CpsF family glycosyltransferase [Candidatus Dojkabacteria bacterium]|nr:WecB/TagA/CpsF family glycosyltransferase [Candidatus Dojkabacteria bacterium]